MRIGTGFGRTRHSRGQRRGTGQSSGWALAEAMERRQLLSSAPNLAIEKVSTLWGSISAADIVGDRAYVVTPQNFFVLDVSAPDTFTEIGSMPLASDNPHITVAGQHAYVATFQDLSVIDVSNPTTPTLVCTINEDKSTNAMAVVGSLLYVAGTSEPLRVFDISDPSAPTLVGAGPLNTWVNGLTVAGPYAYVATTLGVKVFDIPNPALPRPAGDYALACSSADSVAVAGPYLYVAQGGTGLTILRATPAAFTGTAGDDHYVVKMAADGTTVEIYENTPADGAPSYTIARSAVAALSFLTGAGNDTIMGSTGDDCLYGQDGVDLLQGGLGADSLRCGLDNDSIYGGDQSDTIYGDEGDDYIEARGKAGTVSGGSGNDTIWGGAGSDLIFGDEGDDQIDVGPAYPQFVDSVDGGAGTDLVRANANSLVEGAEGDLLA